MYYRRLLGRQEYKECGNKVAQVSDILSPIRSETELKKGGGDNVGRVRYLLLFYFLISVLMVLINGQK